MSWGPYGRRPALVLAGVALIDSVERGILPGALSDAQDDLGFSDFQGGLLGSAVVIASLVMTLPAGVIADRYHRVRLIGCVLASWGVVSAATAGVRNWGQFLGARAALGLADTVDNPASASLLADYYPAASRSRAFAVLRVAPILGVAIGTGLGGLVASVAGWRWAFLVVGGPASLFALVVWRLPNPPRGEQEGRTEDVVREGADAFADVAALLRIPSLRALALGSGIATGGLSGLGFWAPTYFERQGGLSGGQAAGVTGGLLLFGALAGTLLGARVSDRLRARDPGGAMVQAGVTQLVAAVCVFVAFSDVPTWSVRIPLLLVAVPLVVNALPGLAATTAEVVPIELRGMAFSLTTFVSTGIGAFSAPLLGLIADQFEIVVDGDVEGNLGRAFQLVVPLMAIGAAIVWRGSRHAAADAERVGIAPLA